MDTFARLFAALGNTPAWVPLVLLPSLAFLAAPLFWLSGLRRLHVPVAVALAGVGTALFAALAAQRWQHAAPVLLYVGAFAALTALSRLLFLLPRPRPRARLSRGERVWRRFHGTPLPAPAPAPVMEQAPAPATPPPQLAHARSLLEKLQRRSLTAADRLEADVLARSLNGFGGRELSAGEQGVLNDCLASVLRLTAKYNL